MAFECLLGILYYVACLALFVLMPFLICLPFWVVIDCLKVKKVKND